MCRSCLAMNARRGSRVVGEINGGRLLCGSRRLRGDLCVLDSGSCERKGVPRSV